MLVDDIGPYKPSVHVHIMLQPHSSHIQENSIKLYHSFHLICKFVHYCPKALTY